MLVAGLGSLADLRSVENRQCSLLLPFSASLDRLPRDSSISQARTAHTCTPNTLRTDVHPSRSSFVLIQMPSVLLVPQDAIAPTAKVVSSLA